MEVIKTFQRYTPQSIHHVLLENYVRYQQQIGSNIETNNFNAEKKIIQFQEYNGPTIFTHATKKLLTPFISYQNENFTDLDEISRNEFKEKFLELIFNQISSEFPTLKNFNMQLITYQLVAKLGILYFHGKSINLRLSYSLKDVLNIIYGKKVENVKKTARLLTSFNGNKGINDQIDFENYLRRKKFKFKQNKKTYSLKLFNYKRHLTIIIELDENFHFINISTDKEKVFNIDYLRDRRKSYDKTSGEYSDIFDLRFQFNSFNRVTQEEIIDLLQIENPTENILNELLRRSQNNQDLILNTKIKSSFQYLKETDARIFTVPTKDVNNEILTDFSNFFCVKIEKITEYNTKLTDEMELSEFFQLEEQDQIKNPNSFKFIYLEKKLIASSTVYCDFDFNRWLLLLNKLEITLENLKEIISNMGLYLFDQVYDFSNEIFRINNVTIGNNLDYKMNKKSSGWLLDLVEIKNNREKPISTVKFSYQNHLINYDNFALIKKIVYSKNYLEIFDLNMKTVAELDEDSFERSYKNIIKKLNLSVNMPDDQNDDINYLVNQSKGMVRIAYNKLNDAYNTLSNKLKKEVYLQNLKKNKSKQ